MKFVAIAKPANPSLPNRVGTHRHRLFICASLLSVLGTASCASAQIQPGYGNDNIIVPAAHAPQPVEDKSAQPVLSETNPVETPATNPSVEDDRLKPRIYGAPVTEPAPAPTTAAVAVEPAPESSPPDSLEQAAPEQQANVILEREIQKIPTINDQETVMTDEGVVAVAPDETPASKWQTDVSEQFIDVIAGVPIMKDPENCGTNNPTLRILVTNVKKTRGIIVADLHDDVKENFLIWDKVVLRVRATAQQGETSFCMPVPKPGDYSVAIYHDKNGNKEFDKNFLGLPKERFGMSNNPRFGTKSPKYEEATFTVPEAGVDMIIKLRRTSDILSGRQD